MQSMTRDEVELINAEILLALIRKADMDPREEVNRNDPAATATMILERLPDDGTQLRSMEQDFLRRVITLANEHREK